MTREAQREIENQITYRRTVEAVIGIHESGARITEYRDIRVQPSDNPGFDDADLTNPDVRAWWQRWCAAEGEYQAIQAAHTTSELDSIARKADYGDWAEAEAR